MKKTLFLSACCSLFTTCIYAQQLPLSNQYTINKFSLSPAYTGTENAFEIFGSYRNEWMNIPGAPETRMLSANGLFCKNMGIGATISSRKAGIFEDLSASASYAYHLKFSGAHNLSFGLGLGLLESHVNLAGTDAQMNDPLIWNNADVSSMVLDAGFGILYRMRSMHVGISLPQLLSSKIKNVNEKDIYSLVMHQIFNLGYKYTINNNWAIDPIVKVSMAKDVPTFYEFAIPLLYKNKIWITPIYKKTDMAICVGVIPYNNFIVNYAYEFSSKGIMGESGGTHEITIGWRMATRKKTDVPAPTPQKPYYEWLNK